MCGDVYCSRSLGICSDKMGRIDDSSIGWRIREKHSIRQQHRDTTSISWIDQLFQLENIVIQFSIICLKHMKAQARLHMLKDPCRNSVWLVRDPPVWGSCAGQRDASRGSDAIDPRLRLCNRRHTRSLCSSSYNSLQPHDSTYLLHFIIRFALCPFHT